MYGKKQITKKDNQVQEARKLEWKPTETRDKPNPKEC